MLEELQKINQRLIEILSPEKGYFGRVNTWGQRPNKFEPIGFELSENFQDTLEHMTVEQRKNLVTIMYYFEIHAYPLKNLLNAEEKEPFHDFYTDIAWSHFATVVMFGMLEVAVKIQREVKLNKFGDLDNKGEEIKKFLEKNLPQKTKENIAKRYYVEDMFNHKKPTNFAEVVDHLWREIRCGFVHNASIEPKGLEYGYLIGIGTKDDPIRSREDVPMPEWLRITWQAILNSYGYKGLLNHPKLS